jgi:nitrogen regulatory protein PII-like uncharacterized protein
MSGWRAKRDAEMIDRAANDLARAATMPGVLSDEPVFRERVDVLTERLASIG